MRKSLIYFVISFLFFASCGGGLKLATAEKGGTYHQIGASLQKIGLEINTLATVGSNENLELLKKGQADMAIVQADLWEDAAFSDVEVREKIKLVLPLYKEEIHLVAAKNITSLSALKGKKVSIGPKGSGTAATSMALLGFFNLKAQDMQVLNLSTSESLAKLNKGEIDATMIIGGAPLKALTDLATNSSEKIHIVSIDASTLQNVQKFLTYYKPATINAGTYAWHNGPIKTLSVQSVIVGSNATPAEKVKELIQTVKSKRGELQKLHSKWQSIELNYKDYDTSSVHPAAK